MRFRLLRGATVLTALATTGVLAAGTASALTVSPYYHSGKSIAGTGTPGQFQSVSKIDINEANGKLFVYDDGHGAVSQYDASGVPVGFSSQAGANSVSTSAGYYGGLAVNPINGNFYTATENGSINGFDADGAALPAPFPTYLGYNCGLASDLNSTNVWMANYGGGGVLQFSSAGTPVKSFESGNSPCDIAVSEAGYVYASGYGGPIRKYDSNGTFIYEYPECCSLQIAVDPTNDDLFVLVGNEVRQYDGEAAEPTLVTTFGGPEPGFEGLSNADSIAVYGATHEVYVANGRSYPNGEHIEVFATPGEIVIPTVTTDPPETEETGATLKGTVDPDGGSDTAECFFEWGLTDKYGNKADCEPPGPFSGTGPNQVSATVSGLIQGETYHYRLVVYNAEPVAGVGGDQTFKPSGPPTYSDEVTSEVTADGARISGEIEPGGSNTTYHFEYGTGPCDSSPCTSVPVPEAELMNPIGGQDVTQVITGLSAGTTYHWRIVATNEMATTASDHQNFTTYSVASGIDNCPNALVRKQTGANFAPECRAYELVSAANAGGFDVSSDVVVGRSPLPGAPHAEDRVLYALTDGKVPGVSGFPTNFGPDPYLATRGSDRWTTSYVGLPAAGVPSVKSFGSPLAGMNSALDTFAFDGQTICSPCFSDGETGIPVRTPSGQLVQGMAGSMDPDGFDPEGFVARRLSADGTHFVFGTASRFEPDGNSNGDVSIYKRNLTTGVTTVVSKTPGGANLPCLSGPGNCNEANDADGIGALAVSDDGSRVLVGQRISTDSKGNHLWHPYMHVGGSHSTIDLAPGTTAGVQFAGMSSDGSVVYLTSQDQLVAADTDASGDLYRVDVGSSSASLTRVTSTNNDGCNPVPNNNPYWNTTGLDIDCSVAAVGGGGGVSADGTAVYFLSPELLDGGAGVTDHPNLYVARIGSSPQHVATLHPDGLMVRRSVADTEMRNLDDLQVTPGGEQAVFSSVIPQTEYPTLGHSNIYRYDEASDSMVCVSCAPTGAASTSDSRLSGFGLNLTDDGRVFFTTAEQLVLRDTGRRQDVYEWADGEVGLISTGAATTNAGLLTVTADGSDAFFFTRSTLSPDDKNGATMKIYDARENGGFLRGVSPVPCQASDECHGPGTRAAPTPTIGTLPGTGGNVTRRAPPKKCRKGRVKRGGKCVKRKTQRKRHSRGGRR